MIGAMAGRPTCLCRTPVTTSRSGRRTLIIAAVAIPVLAFLAILAWASATSGPARGGLAVNERTIELSAGGELAPPFSMALVGGGEIDTADLHGKVVMLDFWASWCPPCRDEAPTLAQVYAEYRDRGVEFVGVNSGTTPEMPRCS